MNEDDPVHTDDPAHTMELMAENKESSEIVSYSSARKSRDEYGVQRYLKRVGLAILLLFGSLAVTAALVGTSVGLNSLIAFGVGKESQFYQFFQWISSVILIGVGLVVAAAGSIVAVSEAIKSVVDYVQTMWRRDETDGEPH